MKNAICLFEPMGSGIMQFDEARQFILKRLSEELSPEFTYHSLVHIQDVYETAERLAVLEGVSEEETSILLTAVLFHDAGFISGPVDHELVSCSLAREFLPAYGYNSNQIEQICAIIMATQIPQKPENLLEKIICDADLDYLGREDFWEIAHKLYTELHNLGKVGDAMEWNIKQVAFFENHRYFTRSANAMRNRKKEENLIEIKSRLAKGG